MSATTPTGVATAAGFAPSLSSFEQYNTFNGYLAASIPLRHIGGRGEAGFDLVWNLQPGWLAAYNGIPGANAVVAVDPYPSNNIVGATSNAYGLGGPGAVFLRTGASWQACGSGYGVATTVTSIIFVMPNGSQVSLSDNATNGAAEPVPFNSCNSGQPSEWDVGRETSFRSTDGSQLQFNASSSVQEQQINAHGYGVATVSGALLFPNGVTYKVVNSNITSIEDRNGNEISLSYGGPAVYIDWYLSVPALTQVTDSLNRVTTINYSDSSCSGCLSITYAGSGGASRKVEVVTGSLANNYRSGFGAMSIGALFPTSGQPTSYNYNPAVATSIRWPDGSQHSFQYNSWGEVARVNLPTGGAIEYDYIDGAGGSNSGYETGSGGVMIYRRLQARREYANGGSSYTSKTVHNITYPSGQTWDTVQVLDQSGNTLSQTVHVMQGSPLDSLNVSGTICNGWNEGLETQTQYGAPATVTVSNSYTNGSTANCADNPQLTTRLTTLNDTNQQAETLYQYDGYGNVLDEKDYDWGNGTPGGLLREMKPVYWYQQNASYAPPNANLIRLPWYQDTLDGNGNKVAHAEWHYDQSAPADASGIAGHDSGRGAGFTAPRGNAMYSYQWLNTTNVYLQTNYTYDIAGNLLSVTDPASHTTSFSYTDSYSDGQNHNTYAFPTTVSNALGQSTSAQYDYNTGAPTVTVDLNRNRTTYTYNDALDRVTQVRNAINTTAENWRSYSYSAAGSPPWLRIYQDQNTKGDQALVTEQDSDGLGRPTASDVFTDSSHYITTITAYDAAGRVQSLSNPFRPGQDTQLSTIYAYDALGRQTSVTTPDGAVAAVSFSGNKTLSTDQAGHAKQTTVDGLGRITNVGEDPNGTLKYTTDYAYDTLGDLTSVSQGYCAACEGRTFTYDSLGHLLSATNPESGTVSYTYDNVGNLLSRTDSRGITTSYAYDALNRPQTVTYSDNTPGVTLGYDATDIPNAIGRLTTMANAISTTRYTSFDALGNVWSSSQLTAGQLYTFGYSYNLAGALTSETYPSGRIVTTGYDGANRARAVTGQFAGTVTNYVSNMSYWPQGAPYYFTYGNSLWRVAGYNARLQPLETYDALNNQNDAAHMLLFTCPNWGAANANPAVYVLCPATSGTQDNGNLLGLQIAHGGTKFSATYGYDTVNRLTSATESGGWSQSYSYDQYGNLWMPGSSGLPAYGAMPSANVYNARNQNPNVSYDAAGNQTVLGALTLSYDAENRQTLAVNLGGGSGSYQYDGAGKRVVKILPTQAMVYVYDAFGQLAAEYDSQAMAAACVTCYLSYDHLGTVRMVTDQNGNVVARHDFAPFGQEIPAGWAGRGSLWGSTTDVDMKFTGQLRDNETGEDYFNARYLYSQQLRFMSVDPVNAGADVTNPQSWNGYGYVLGNPLGNTDPSGMDPILVNCPDCTVTVPGGSVDDIGTFNYSWFYGRWGPTSLSGGGGDPVSPTALYSKGVPTVSTSATPAKNGPSIGYCFVKGLVHGGVGTAAAAVVTAAVATVAAPEVVTAGLLIAGGSGAALLVQDFMHSGSSGRAYDVGSAFGGTVVGGASTFGVRNAITGETNLPSGIVDFLGLKKVYDPRLGINPVPAFKKGPDLLGGAAALLGAGSGVSLLGKGDCQ